MDTDTVKSIDLDHHYEYLIKPNNSGYFKYALFARVKGGENFTHIDSDDSYEKLQARVDKMKKTKIGEIQ